MTILKIGRNAWRAERASRASILIDGCNYFTHLERALKDARRSIIIIGWDFDGGIKLCPDDEQCLPLGPFLHSLVEEKPELTVHILVWSAAVVHAQSAAAPLLFGADWQEHERITLKLDHNHPIYASQHQKVVVIDDSIAFIGGMDLTVRRWDTCQHAEANPYRQGADGTPYNPIHDIQMAVAGDAAAALGELARNRWHAATGDRLPASPRRAMWVAGLKPDFHEATVGIARTAPARADRPAVHEIAELTVDVLGAARHSIYIEAQYFTASNVRRALERSLAASEGPEIVVVATRAPPGMLERLVMNRNRDRLIRRLRRADRHNRFRVFYPVVAGEQGACDVQIHSKLIIVDDAILRVGSANLNNRSMGLDSECDVVIEAANEAEAGAIARIRDRLIGEHLGVEPDEVAQVLTRKKSLIRTIAEFNGNGRGLRPFPELDLEGPTRPIAGTGLFDPQDALGVR
jgi:phosphatidylserine/phosphatidylglycerophosphate/cardiolipin synthase-like enzyme